MGLHNEQKKKKKKKERKHDTVTFRSFSRFSWTCDKDVLPRGGKAAGAAGAGAGAGVGLSDVVADVWGVDDADVLGCEHEKRSGG